MSASLWNESATLRELCSNIGNVRKGRAVTTRRGDWEGVINSCDGSFSNGRESLSRTGGGNCVRAVWVTELRVH